MVNSLVLSRNDAGPGQPRIEKIAAVLKDVSRLQNGPGRRLVFESH